MYKAAIERVMCFKQIIWRLVWVVSFILEFPVNYKQQSNMIALMKPWLDLQAANSQTWMNANIIFSTNPRYCF